MKEPAIEGRMKRQNPSHCNFVERVYTASYQDEHHVSSYLREERRRQGRHGTRKPATNCRAPAASKKPVTPNKSRDSQAAHRAGISCRTISRPAANTATRSREARFWLLNFR